MTWIAIETYDQAMSWFGADKDTADDYIISLYKVKVSALI